MTKTMGLPLKGTWNYRSITKARPRLGRREQKERITKLCKSVSALILSVIFGFPFIWMFFGSFKSNNEIFHTPGRLLPQNMDISLWIQAAVALPIYSFLLNSFMVALVGTLLLMVFATLFVYALVFLRNKWTDGLFALVLATYMLPAAITYIPSFVILVNLGLHDSLAGLVLSCLPHVFTIFYFRQNFKKISPEYMEAAKMDGAGHLSMIRHIVLPMSKSAYYAAGLLYFVYMYNNYMWPTIILRSSDNFLISQGLNRFFITEGAYGMNWSEIMMANTIAVAPLLIALVIAHKHFVTGIAGDSGLKG